jgi:hypothetical protein
MASLLFDLEYLPIIYLVTFVSLPQPHQPHQPLTMSWTTLLFLVVLLCYWEYYVQRVEGWMSMMATKHSPKHPDRFHLSGKSSKRPRKIPLPRPITCKIKLSRLDRGPKPIQFQYEREGEPDQIDELIAAVENYLQMPGEFSKYFHDPEILKMRTEPEMREVLLQAFQTKKDERSVTLLWECYFPCLTYLNVQKRLPPPESVKALQQLCAAIHRIDAASPEKNWFGEIEDPTKMDSS